MPRKSKVSKRKTNTKRISNNNNSVNNMLSNFDITDCLLIIIVILVIYYLLMNNNSTEGYSNNNSNSNKPTMMLFHAKWCGHCVRFMPEWKKFKKQTNINVVEYEADENTKDIEENKVKGFPTIKCKTVNGDVREFEGERTIEGLNKFAEECSK